MFNVWQERSQIVKHVKCSSGDELTLTLQLCVSVWFFCGDYFLFHQNSVWADRIVQMFFPNPCFYRSLKRFFFFFAFFYQWKKVWMCFIVILLIICFHVWIQVTFHLFSFRRSFSLWFFQPVSHIKKMSLFVSLCTWLPFFSSLKKKVFTHNGKKQKKNEKDSSSKTLFSFLVGRGFYSFLTFKKNFPY